MDNASATPLKCRVSSQQLGSVGTLYPVRKSAISVSSGGYHVRSSTHLLFSDPEYPEPARITPRFVHLDL